MRRGGARCGGIQPHFVASPGSQGGGSPPAPGRWRRSHQWHRSRAQHLQLPVADARVPCRCARGFKRSCIAGPRHSQGLRSAARGEEASRARAGRGVARAAGRGRSAPFLCCTSRDRHAQNSREAGSKEGADFRDELQRGGEWWTNLHPGPLVPRLNGGSLELGSSACAATRSGSAGVLVGLQRAVEWGTYLHPGE